MMMKKTWFFLGLLVLASCGPQDVADRDGGYRDDNRRGNYYNDDDNRRDRDDRDRGWWPW